MEGRHAINRQAPFIHCTSNVPGASAPTTVSTPRGAAQLPFSSPPIPCSPSLKFTAVVEYSETRLMHASLIRLQSCPPREKDTRRAAFSAVATAVSNPGLSDNDSVGFVGSNNDPCLGAPAPAASPPPTAAAEVPVSPTRR